MSNAGVPAGWPGRGWMTAMWLGIAGLLAAPAIAMRFGDEVQWTTFDFVFAGVVLIGAGLVVELTRARMKNVAYRAGVCTAVLAAVLLIWVTGAVGIIASEAHPGNALYLGVLGVAALGSLVGRMRAGGTALAMFAAAAVQAAIGVVALALGWGAGEPMAPWDVIGATGMFTALWLAAGWLFLTAARQTARTGA